MKIRISVLIFCLAALNSYSQERKYSFDAFAAKIENNNLVVVDTAGKTVFRKVFNNPREQSADLDGDGINELLVTDLNSKGDKNFYTLYIFNTVDSFYVADSIPSGLMEPYQTVSEDTEGIIIITGNTNFDSLNTNEGEAYVPIKCWKYEDAKVHLINDKVYDIFISENDTLTDILDSYLESNPNNCNSIEEVKAVIASVYANYMNAGEKILAYQFLKKYYPCSDLETFKQKLNELL